MGCDFGNVGCRCGIIVILNIIGKYIGRIGRKGYCFCCCLDNNRSGILLWGRYSCWIFFS